MLVVTVLLVPMLVLLKMQVLLVLVGVVPAVASLLSLQLGVQGGHEACNAQVRDLCVACES